VIWITDNLPKRGLKATCISGRDNPLSANLRLKGLAKLQSLARQLENALARQDAAFQRDDSDKYAAAAMAEDARSALASVPALTVAEILVKAKALGPVPAAATLASLSEGEAALVASILRDIRRMAALRTADDDA
jgi:hypothetical protein